MKKNTKGIKNTSGQVISAKAARRAERRKAIKKASKNFVPGSYDKLKFPKPKR